MLQDKMLFLEAEARGRIEECNRLWIQLQNGGLEKIQFMRALVKAGARREPVICIKRNQLQECKQARIDQILLLEQETKQLWEKMDQSSTKTQDVCENKAQCAWYQTMLAEMEVKLQTLQETL